MPDVKRARSKPAKRTGWLFIGFVGFLALTDVLAWAVLWNVPNPISVALAGPPPMQADPLPTPLFQTAEVTPGPVR